MLKQDLIIFRSQFTLPARTGFSIMNTPDSHIRSYKAFLVKNLYTFYAFVYSENMYEPQQQHSCPDLWLALSRIANNRQLMVSKFLYKHDIL